MNMDNEGHSDWIRPRNVWDMRRLFQTYSDPEILRQAVAELDNSLIAKNTKFLWEVVIR